MGKIVQFESKGHLWTATETFGESEQHKYMAAGAHERHKPYCRQHLLGIYKGRLSETIDDPLARFRDILIKSKFDLTAEFDILVVESPEELHNPVEYLNELQKTGSDLFAEQPELEVPDYAYLDELALVSSATTYSQYLIEHRGQQ